MIWCVEDEVAIRDIEVYTLQLAGFEARGFEDGDSCWKALQEESPDLIVLDVMLPGMDGIELLKKIRSSSELFDLPIIMATAKGAEYEKIQGLDLGADDYLVKPFGIMELVSRVKAVLRRYKPRPEPNVMILTYGGIVMNLNEHSVKVDGNVTQLTLKEYELLRLFMTKPGTIFTRDHLFDVVWGADFCGESRTLDMHIRTLRRKIGEYGNQIETIRNVGYRMVKLL